MHLKEAILNLQTPVGNSEKTTSTKGLKKIFPRHTFVNSQTSISLLVEFPKAQDWTSVSSLSAVNNLHHAPRLTVVLISDNYADDRQLSITPHTNRQNPR